MSNWLSRVPTQYSLVIQNSCYSWLSCTLSISYIYTRFVENYYTKSGVILYIAVYIIFIVIWWSINSQHQLSAYILIISDISTRFYWSFISNVKYYLIFICLHIFYMVWLIVYSQIQCYLICRWFQILPPDFIQNL